jgi:hypothetical protein
MLKDPAARGTILGKNCGPYPEQWKWVRHTSVGTLGSTSGDRKAGHCGHYQAEPFRSDIREGGSDGSGAGYLW